MIRITHTEYHVQIFFARRTRAAARKSSHQFSKKIEDSIYHALSEAARKQLQEHVKAGRLARGFGPEMVS